MQKLSNIELYLLSKEFQTLVKSRLVKVYCDGERSYRFKFKKEGFEYDLQVVMPQGVYLTKYARNGIENNFVRALRTRIQNWIVDSVKLLNSDKIIVIELGRFSLFLDFIGKGNIVLTQENNIELIEYEDDKRDLKKGKPYSVPSIQLINFLDYENQENYSTLNLPKSFKEKISSAKDWKKTFKSFLENPVITSRNELLVLDFEGESSYSSLSECLDSLNKPSTIQRKNPERIRFEKRLESQLEALTKAEKKLDDLKTRAELINSNRWSIEEKIKNKDFKENNNEIIIDVE